MISGSSAVFSLFSNHLIIEHTKSSHLHDRDESLAHAVPLCFPKSGALPDTLISASLITKDGSVSPTFSIARLRDLGLQLREDLRPVALSRLTLSRVRWQLGGRTRSHRRFDSPIMPQYEGVGEGGSGPNPPTKGTRPMQIERGNAGLVDERRGSRPGYRLLPYAVIS
jgi:hypothetical protein